MAILKELVLRAIFGRLERVFIGKRIAYVHHQGENHA